jgi:hypothetical protein
MAWRVGKTLSVVKDRQHGYGFNVSDDKGTPLITFAYKTPDESDAAAEKIRSVISNAIWVAKAP